MKRMKHFLCMCIASLIIFQSPYSRADMFGGDIVILTQILANAVQQLVQLKQILSNGADTLDLLRDVNRGIRDGLSAIRMTNPKFNPGLYGDLTTAEQVQSIINDLYGRIPEGADSKLHQAHDRSASESIAMNGTMFKFADQADEESKRIIAHAQDVNPQGAAKLTAQSMGVLIGVTTQVLRSNSMMLKMLGENMALENRREKIQASQFKTQYDGLSRGLHDLPRNPKLKPLEVNR